ncbi:hypothetical protein BDQ12DRAFT_637106 [Crucibulum laeve]|uniref:Tyrosinase copper-binding domain-containing protein n=1 Tax=Crucibulum laeve TaxID=68775 RepID=A0A5C3LN96_9AGAR|nr:hypothetical protein BDQ12DRAFT_637106 [Crucibulum laeve]
MHLKKKSDYIEAVKCLQSKPATTSFQGVRTRFDDFQALHINLAEVIHAVGQFLGWHRQFLFVYEKALREECGYQGTQPYWNWSEDTDDIIKAPVFDAHTGFGGNGVDGTYPDVFGINPSQNSNRTSGWGGGCVKDGPFASYEVALGPGKLINDHCLVRGIRQDFAQFITYEAVANATKQPTFEIFRIELEGMPITPTHKMHDGGHLAVGGEMQNLYSSPADPLFYLHHANLDRIWWEWQAVNFTDRLYQVSGRSTVPPPWVNITLDFPLDMGTLGETVPIRDAMDIRQAPLCYIYV